MIDSVPFPSFQVYCFQMGKSESEEKRAVLFAIETRVRVPCPTMLVKHATKHLAGDSIIITYGYPHFVVIQSFALSHWCSGPGCCSDLNTHKYTLREKTLGT